MTFLGKHTIEETRALMADVDHRFTVDDAVYHELKPRLVDKLAPLATNWEALKKRWESDRNAISIKLTAMNVTNITPSNMIPSEPEYQTVLGYVEKDSGDPNFHPNDSIRGIELQFQQLRGQPIDIDTGRPSLQGPPPSDPDEDFLKNQTIAAAAKAGEKVASAATNPNDHTLRNIGIGAGVGAALILAIKILK